mmetsp:Transcript_12889/g.22272  ORF Transcript_12889/g.22272 Transcript_12889/m.22272 type:complete len:416 (-) Transcript_12889:66-1313(-)
MQGKRPAQLLTRKGGLIKPSQATSKTFKEAKGGQAKVGMSPAPKRFKPTAAPAPMGVGEVRFEESDSAQRALELSGSEVDGNTINVTLDLSSKDQSKIMVTGLPIKCGWQELKDHFASCGAVAFATIKGSSDSGSSSSGTVRYATEEEASQAMAMLNGSILGGSPITVQVSRGSRDGTRLTVTGFPAGVVQWQELKDHFAQAGGDVLFAEVSAGTAMGGEMTGEVRFEDAEAANTALTSMNGSFLGGGRIFIQTDPTSHDGTKLIVRGVQPGVEWQELKDHFGSVGTVAFCTIKPAPGSAVLAPAKGIGKNGGMLPMKGLGKGMAGSFGFMGANVRGPTGEVRYHNPMHAQMAVLSLNGSFLMGSPISVIWDQSSIDGTKLMVRGVGLGSTIKWQELKDHFGSVGPVAFAKINGG